MLRRLRVSKSLLIEIHWRGGENVSQLYVGIDVSKNNNVVCLMQPNGTKYSTFSVSNNLGGAKQLSEKIVAALKQTNLTDVVIGMEATSVYGDNLMCFLREDGSLGQFNRKLHMLNPKQVKKFKDAYSDLPKNDTIDSFVIADNLRFGRITAEVYMDDYRYQALQNLTRARFFCVQSLTKEKNRFLNNLYMKCSGLTQEKVFSDLYGATSMAVMEAFETVDELAYMDVDELAAFISKTGRGRFENPEAVAKALKSAARGSYRLPKTINDSINQVLSVSIATIRSHEAQIKILDKSISKQFEIISNTLTSINGIGLVYSAGIIAELGDINRFESHASVAKYAGLVWNRNQSGDFQSQHSRMIKSGNRYLRYYMLEAANSLRRCDSEFKRYYDLKFKEVNKYQHKRALALTARKLVRLVFRLLKDNRLYIPPEA